MAYEAVHGQYALEFLQILVQVQALPGPHKSGLLPLLSPLYFSTRHNIFEIYCVRNPKMTHRFDDLLGELTGLNV